MKIYVAVRVLVVLYCAVTYCTCNSSQELTQARHSRVRYLPSNLHKTIKHPPFMHFWETTDKSDNGDNFKLSNSNYRINQKGRRNPQKFKKNLKRSNINITEIIGYLNSNPSKDVKIVNTEYLNGLGQFNINAKLTDNGENVVSNLNTLLVNVKNFSCDVNNGGCSQFCKDSNVVKCTCLKGFQLDNDKKNCLDVNECLRNNGGCSHTCINTHGFYRCVCPKGLRLGDDFKSCKDVNECLLRNGHGPCQDACKNTFGSYECTCSIKGSRLSADRHTCEDVNECLQGTSGCSHGCINIIGGAICTCPYGTALKDDLQTCSDVEEQSDDVNICPPIIPPKHGYLRCQRKKPLEYFDIKNDELMVTQLGVTCTLVCQKGYKTIGDYKLICGFGGAWSGNRTAQCLPISDRKFNRRNNFIEVVWAYTKPKISCSPPILLRVSKNKKLTRVRLRPPKTNVNWTNVKSFPSNVKKSMEIYLPVGHHSVIFEATNSIAKLSAKCVISIIIKRDNDS